MTRRKQRLPQTSRGAVKRKAYSTTTRTSDDRLVPWLAAEGPLAYTPESPPVRDSLFQYGWVLPQVCKPGLRRHTYFGAIRREDAHDVFAFWQDARRGTVERVAHHEGTLAGGSIEAPIAVYRHNTRRGDMGYLFIQHGSYQCGPVDEQPELEGGYVHLHRGLGDAKSFASRIPFEPERSRDTRVPGVPARGLGGRSSRARVVGRLGSRAGDGRVTRSAEAARALDPEARRGCLWA
jgi:hypothetical protein